MKQILGPLKPCSLRGKRNGSARLSVVPIRAIRCLCVPVPSLLPSSRSRASVRRERERERERRREECAGDKKTLEAEHRVKRWKRQESEKRCCARMIGLGQNSSAGHNLRAFFSFLCLKLEESCECPKDALEYARQNLLIYDSSIFSSCSSLPQKYLRR